MAGILSEREAIANQLQGVLDLATDPWGIYVERVEVKDVLLPLKLQRAMAQEAEADREAKAKVNPYIIAFSNALKSGIEIVDWQTCK